MPWTELYFETQYLAGVIISVMILAGVSIVGIVKLIMLIVNKIRK